MSEAPQEAATPVTIYGRTYRLRGTGEAGYLEHLAVEVDRRMREVADATGTADTMKVAILAALNIMDDCLQARSRQFTDDTRERLGRMADLLGEVLVEGKGDPRSAATDGGETTRTRFENETTEKL